MSRVFNENGYDAERVLENGIWRDVLNYRKSKKINLSLMLILCPESYIIDSEVNKNEKKERLKLNKISRRKK